MLDVRCLVSDVSVWCRSSSSAFRPRLYNNKPQTTNNNNNDHNNNHNNNHNNKTTTTINYLPNKKNKKQDKTTTNKKQQQLTTRFRLRLHHVSAALQLRLFAADFSVNSDLGSRDKTQPGCKPRQRKTSSAKLLWRWVPLPRLPFGSSSIWGICHFVLFIDLGLRLRPRKKLHGRVPHWSAWYPCSSLNWLFLSSNTFKLPPFKAFVTPPSAVTKKNTRWILSINKTN